MKIRFTWKIWLWIILLILSLVSIFITPTFLQKGVLITNVEQNSSAFEQGLRAGQVITAIDGKAVQNVEDYSKIIQAKFPSAEKVKTTITTKDAEYVIYSEISPQMAVSNLPQTNLKMGLDLAGGSRALVQAQDHKLTSSEVNDLVSIVSNRFNVYGLSDVTVKSVSDLSGNNFMLVEIAGATPEDLENLISEQGKFEAKIGNDTVFMGEKKDITNVARGGQEAGITNCQQSSNGYACQFRFTIYLSQTAAEKQANLTNALGINSTSSGDYLSKTLDLYVDGNLQDSLNIGSDLKGQITTQVAISGSGTGPTQDDAITSALENMNKLQTILITGSLPFKLQIVKLDTVSPTLGNDFLKYILIAAFVSIFLVAVIVLLRYRSKSAIAPLVVCTSEIIITLGIAALIKWNLDLPSIAGILAAIGTGVDDQIVILDETKHKEESLGIKQRIKRAFVIILGAYFTVVASLLPLFWAGAGLLTGFALTTIIGITIGVLITRPAFADMIRLMEKENAS
ncbi:Protein-export membrane protein SecD [uncultured archaeon]|nr:Protein-export membrane protein SecD [uncultured archaeon]